MIGYRHTEERENLKDLIEAGYRPGYITRIGMKNFLTYDKADVYPGPRLNVVLGPNGIISLSSLPTIDYPATQ